MPEASTAKTLRLIPPTTWQKEADTDIY